MWNKVIVFGAGGTGSALINPLARYLRSVQFKGDLIIVDGDSYSASNLDRQLFGQKFIGTNKAEYQVKALLSQMPDLDTQMNLEFINEYLGEDQINALVDENTILINCTDNRAARKFVEDRGSTLQNFAHICCGNELRTGQTQLSLRRDGKQITPTIYKRVPKFNSTDDNRYGLSCEQLAALPSGGQLIFANMMCASLALNFLNMLFSPSPLYQYAMPADAVFFDCGTNKMVTESDNTLADCITPPAVRSILNQVLNQVGVEA